MEISFWCYDEIGMEIEIGSGTDGRSQALVCLRWQVLHIYAIYIPIV